MVMKSETANAVLTFVLGALVLLSVIFTLQTIFRTREFRALQMAVPERTYMMTVEALAREAQEYGKTHPDIRPLLEQTHPQTKAAPATR